VSAVTIRVAAHAVRRGTGTVSRPSRRPHGVGMGHHEANPTQIARYPRQPCPVARVVLCVWRVSTPKMPGNRSDAAHIEVGSGSFHTQQPPTERTAVRQCQFTLSAKHEPGVKSPVSPLSRRFSSTRLIPRDMRTDPESACVPRGINPIRYVSGSTETNPR
jgi:hypothetical protein